MLKTRKIMLNKKKQLADYQRFTHLFIFVSIKFYFYYPIFLSIKKYKIPQSHIWSNVTIVTTCYKNVTASNLHQY